MKHIEKITLNSARRFDEHVEIEFGKGATILLAPNGIGKTTIFEAIEFALTKGVRRLGLDLDAIIRDGHSGMSVRLDFSKEKYCQLDYRKGAEEVSVEGCYDQLFTIDNRLSVPYLFHLTHFLEQRGSDWFVSQTDKEAGSILGKLPIGKELGIVLKKKSSCLGEITAKIKINKAAVEQAKEKFDSFQLLLDKRNEHANEIELTSLEEIVTRLVSVNNVVQVEDWDGEYTLLAVKQYFEKLRISLQQRTSENKRLIVTMSGLRDRIAQYAENCKYLEVKQKSVSQDTVERDKLKVLINEVVKNSEEDRDKLVNILKEEESLKSIKVLFETVSQKRENVDHKNKELNRNTKELAELCQTQEETVKFIEHQAQLKDRHKIVNEQITKSKQDLRQEEQKKEFQKTWQELSKENQISEEENIPEIQRVIEECTKSKSGVDEQVRKAEETYLVRKQTLDSLVESSGAIQDAVSKIRQNLSENQRECPVCEASYEPSELVQRIERSLEKINPAISGVMKEEKVCSDHVRQLRDEQRIIAEKLKRLQSELELEQGKVADKRKEISEIIISSFSDCKTAEEALQKLNEETDRITARIQELESEKKSLEPLASSEKLNDANLRKNRNERSIEGLTSKNTSIQNMIEADTNAINEIVKSLDGKKQAIVFDELSVKSEEVTKARKALSELETQLSQYRHDLKALEESILAATEAISKVKASQNGILSEWEQAGFRGQPCSEELKTRLGEVTSRGEQYDNANETINTLEFELGKWNSSEKFREFDGEVKKQVGKLSEETYLDQLKQRWYEKECSLQKIEKTKKIAGLLLDNVKLRSDEIHEQLNLINGPWQGLLRRVVTSSLIRQAPLLDNKVERNKPKATISADIHNRKFGIDKIASEAQLTDLQLTLMLALANKYNWTPWKALLLDDPTQHHDLVHASSVFDVLRDYIIDLDYQVMMSTHDSIQAKFFQRKLENEGVPSKIYQLVTRKGGVTAERMI